jgi:hypothetical protein
MARDPPSGKPAGGRVRATKLAKRSKDMATTNIEATTESKSTNWLYWSTAAAILVLGIYNLIIC